MFFRYSGQKKQLPSFRAVQNSFEFKEIEALLLSLSFRA